MKFIFLPSTIANALEERYESLASVELSKILDDFSYEDRHFLALEAEKFSQHPALVKLGIENYFDVPVQEGSVPWNYQHHNSTLKAEITIDGNLILCECADSPIQAFASIELATQVLCQFAKCKGISEMMLSKEYDNFKKLRRP